MTSKEVTPITDAELQDQLQGWQNQLPLYIAVHIKTAGAPRGEYIVVGKVEIDYNRRNHLVRICRTGTRNAQSFLIPVSSLETNVKIPALR